MNAINKTAGAAAVSSTIANTGTAVVAAVVKEAAKAKPENYTAAEVTRLLAGYAAGKSTDELAVEFGKTKRSIVAKLSREGVYKKQEYVTKTGDAPISKDALVVELAKTMGVDEARLGGLEKANKPTIQLLSQVIGDYAVILTQEDDSETKKSKQQSILMIANCLNVPLESVASLKLVDRETLQFVAAALDNEFSDDSEPAKVNLTKASDAEQTARDLATVEKHETSFPAEA